MDYKDYFRDKPPPVFREFAIAICDLLLEHPWKDEVTKAVEEVRTSLRAEQFDLDRVRFAGHNAYNLCIIGHNAACAADDAAYAVYCAHVSAQSQGDSVRYAYAYDAAYRAALAAEHTIKTLPGTRDRVHAIVLMLT